MPSNILHLYPNCSLGGMTTVYRNRALSDPESHFTFLFMNDKSGSVAYNSLPNVTMRISQPDRYESMVSYAVSKSNYDSIRITSLPGIVSKLGRCDAEVIYEFHSSDQGIIQRELDVLDLSLVDKIATPSEYLAEVIRAKVSVDQRSMVVVIPNLVDRDVFSVDGPVPMLSLDSNSLPLVWIGRLDKGKNVNDFLRLLSLLPDVYTGIIILSFEDQPGRLADFLGLAASLGLDTRIKILLNLSQHQIADIYRFSRNRNGFFCSTSLGESFGYGVAEALSVGLSTIAYDVGALKELSEDAEALTLVPVGDVRGLAREVLAL